MRRKQTEVDYTTFRKGTRTGGRIIAYCPKCGRKGFCKPAWTDAKGFRWPATYTHKGFNAHGWFTTTDLCIITDVDNGQ